MLLQYRGRILGHNWDKSQEFSSLLFTVTSTNGFYPPPPPSKSGLKLVCNVRIVYTEISNLRTLKIMPRNLRKFMNAATAEVPVYIWKGQKRPLELHKTIRKGELSGNLKGQLPLLPSLWLCYMGRWVVTQNKHRVTMNTFLRTFHHDGKISLV
jgi:hypothetical protein